MAWQALLSVGYKCNVWNDIWFWKASRTTFQFVAQGLKLNGFIGGAGVSGSVLFQNNTFSIAKTNKNPMNAFLCSARIVLTALSLFLYVCCAAVLDKSTNMLRSVIKKQNGDQGCSSSRKSMKFLRVTTG